jgi:hypothetical protein
MSMSKRRSSFRAVFDTKVGRLPWCTRAGTQIPVWWLLPGDQADVAELVNFKLHHN